MTTPTIPNGASYMAASLYTGNSSTQTVSNAVNGVAMQPDFVWIKNRTTASQHVLTDSVRGVTKQLFSSNTNAEQTSATGITSLNSNGFSLDTNVSPTGSTNSSPDTYVAWNWKAGGTAVSNTNGSITSSVSANTTSGFSVVTWTNPASGTPTIGHGLGVAPTFIIVKDRTYAYNWDVGCTSIGWANRLNLNTTGATSSGFWNSTAPTSTVFTYAASGANSGDSMVAYCFAPIAGYSAFGSYTGNGSADGPFVYTGFRPRWILFKDSTNSATNWVLQDTSRFTYNLVSGGLLANTSASEYSSGYDVDILSNGFKIRRSGGDTNQSSANVIYASFAENPFKYALAR